MVFTDLFALGCLLHAQGHTTAGRKMVDEVLGAVKQHGTKTYLSDLKDALPGNEFAFARQIHAHLEVNELLDAENTKKNT